MDRCVRKKRTYILVNIVLKHFALPVGTEDMLQTNMRYVLSYCANKLLTHTHRKNKTQIRKRKLVILLLK